MTRRDARLRPSAYGLGLRRASRRRKMTQFIELSQNHLRYLRHLRAKMKIINK
jgi:hypothetical protein